MYSKTILTLFVFLSQSLPADTLRRGLGPEPDSLHIHHAQGLSSIHLLREIREGLVTFDVDGEPAPGVAKSWEVLGEGRLYRFNLRTNARWSNGDELVAGDFVRAWRLAVTPASAARNASLLAAVENSEIILAGKADPASLGILAVDDHTLEVRLAYPQPWFPEILAHPVTYPLHPADTDSPGEAMVNGAFKIDRMTPHALIRLVKNHNFHSASQVKLDVLELLPIEDPPAELSRYRAGELHITESIPPGRYAWLQEHHAGELRVAPYLGSFWLGFNQAMPPFKDNPGLRTALALAIDRETLVRVVLGAGEKPAWSVVPPGLGGSGSLAAPINSQQQREQEARRLFAQSGYDRRKPLRIELRYNTSSQNRRIAVAVAAMWKQVLGVATVLINEEWKVFVNNRRQRVLTQVFRGGWIADYADPASFLDMFRTGDAMNWGAYTNPSYDDLMGQAAFLGGNQRLEQLQKAESALMRDMPVIPLYYYVSRHLVKPGVGGFNDNVRDIHLSRYLDINAEAE
jgi:ABC-type oligopeptide transport system substrate-binding subunit